MKKFFIVLCLVSVSLTIAAEIKVIAHRGYWKADGAVQNGLLALQAADQIGVYGSECDVWMTKDGELMMFHDKYFTINGKEYSIREVESSKLKEVELKNGEHPVTFKKFLRKFGKTKKITLVIELKSDGNKEAEKEQVEKILKQVKKFQLEDRVEYIAFSKNVCDEIVKQNRKAKISYLNGKLTPKEISRLGYTGIDYHYSWIELHPEWVKEAHKLGLTVNVWNVNKEDTMNDMIKQGVDFITTDDPEMLLDIIKQH